MAAFNLKQFKVKVSEANKPNETNIKKQSASAVKPRKTGGCNCGK